MSEKDVRDFYANFSFAKKARYLMSVCLQNVCQHVLLYRHCFQWSLWKTFTGENIENFRTTNTPSPMVTKFFPGSPAIKLITESAITHVSIDQTAKDTEIWDVPRDSAQEKCKEGKLLL